MNHSKCCPSLSISFFQISGKAWIPRQILVRSSNPRPLRQSTNQDIFRCLRINETVDQPVHVPVNGTSNNRAAQYLKNIAVGVGLPVWELLVRFVLVRTVWQCGQERCYTVESFFVPFLVFWLFFAQRSAQSHQFNSIIFSSDGFVWFVHLQHEEAWPGNHYEMTLFSLGYCSESIFHHPSRCKEPLLFLHLKKLFTG